jgi:hypothetical protein
MVNELNTKTKRSKCQCKVYNMGLLLVFDYGNDVGPLYKTPSLEWKKKSLEMGIELNTKMKRNQLQNARPNARFIFNVWLWE